MICVVQEILHPSAVAVKQLKVSHAIMGMGIEFRVLKVFGLRVQGLPRLQPP